MTMKQGKMTVCRALTTLLLAVALACVGLVLTTRSTAVAHADTDSVHDGVYGEYTMDFQLVGGNGNYGFRNNLTTTADTMYMEFTVTAVSATPASALMGVATEAGKDVRDWRSGSNNLVFNAGSGDIKAQFATDKTLRLEFDMSAPNDGTKVKYYIKQGDGSFALGGNAGSAVYPTGNSFTAEAALYRGMIIAWGSESNLTLSNAKCYDSNGNDLGFALRTAGTMGGTLTATLTDSRAAQMKEKLESATEYTVDLNAATGSSIFNAQPMNANSMFMYMDFTDVTIVDGNAGIAAGKGTTRPALYLSGSPTYYHQGSGNTFTQLINNKKILYWFNRNTDKGYLYTSADGETYTSISSYANQIMGPYTKDDGGTDYNNNYANRQLTEEEFAALIHRGLQLNGANLTGKVKAKFVSSDDTDLGVLAALKDGEGDGIVQNITVTSAGGGADFDTAALSGYKKPGTVLDFTKQHYDVSYTVNGGEPVNDNTYTVVRGVDAEIVVTHTAHEYSITFVAGETFSETKKYTIENYESFTEPTVPEKQGYTGAWKTYTLEWTDDQVVEAEYTEIGAATTYTVTFKADGVVVGTQTYTAENKNITEPDVPVKAHYTGAWEAYTLTTGDITVNAVYTAITYTVTFKADGVVVTTLTYTVENNTITEPSVPEKEGYEGKWAAYTLNGGDKVVEAVYTEKGATPSTPASSGKKKCGATIGGDSLGIGMIFLLLGGAMITFAKRKKNRAK